MIHKGCRNRYKEIEMHQLKVILADDEKIILTGLKTLFDWEKNGFSLVGEATDGISAIDLARETRPDIIIIDINMPFKSGLDVIREINQFLPEARFLIISGYNDYTLMRTAIQLKVSDYLIKPVRFEVLALTLAHLREDIFEHIYKTNQEKAENNENQSPLIDRMIAYIDEHYNEDLSLSKLSNLFKMNSDYISCYFKKKKGLHFSDYVNSRRVYYAKRLLKTTDLNIDEISDRVGFSNYRYFSKVFQQYIGIPPSQYR